MFTVYKKEMELGGKKLTLETGKVARQADGAVIATYGDTQVMATVCFAKQPRVGLDFFPLTVEYREKFYAAGRIPGGFFKREARPTEKEVLTCRLIDRPIRPLFVKGFKNETQVVCTVLSTDGENDPDMIAMVAASAALTISGVPFMGPIGAVRVGYVDGEFVINPTRQQVEDIDLNLVVAGTTEGVLMVESEAKELPESTMLDAVMAGHNECKRIIEAIIELAEAAAKPGFDMAEPEDTSALAEAMQAKLGTGVVEAYGCKAKADRKVKLEALKDQAIEEFVTDKDDSDEVNKVKGLFKGMESDVLRGSLLDTKVRIDGRTTTDIRPIVAEVDVLKRAHGSALFTRGETQAIVVATLGSGRDEQMIDDIHGEYKDRFMLHYNFPPFCVGEVGRMGGTSRREIGHGWLARRALSAMLPNEDDCPYTIRIVSEITESNGSSSMATVCGSSLAMMAAGVKLKRPVAGIAMGLIKEGDRFAVLSDILGDEDHLGDMDFKVAGTSEGITALQMDIKITSITKDIMAQALDQAKDGRMHILGKMATALTESRKEVSEHAPGMESFQIDKEKIREVIGTGGKVIRSLTEETGCSIDISDEGMITVSSPDRAALKDCVERIKGIVATPEEGKQYSGEITRIADFGAFVKVLPNFEGLLHVSEMVNVRVNDVNSILNEGEVVTVDCLKVEGNGKVRLSMKGVEQTEEIEKRLRAFEETGGDKHTPRPSGGDRGRDNRRPRRAS